ncbi:44879_t:CDS:2 [Gigaspora margarita]|uniref:44879_t:CDS:1 n=1 Tax=Gigaspora margarita TaxID=4874 RepID=A0ABN7UG10_GIGMA|nr:44879_t:CDS:2 [Gigaspora margarita]
MRSYTAGFVSLFSKKGSYYMNQYEQRRDNRFIKGHNDQTVTVICLPLIRYQTPKNANHLSMAW